MTLKNHAIYTKWIEEDELPSTLELARRQGYYTRVQWFRPRDDGIYGFVILYGDKELTKRLHTIKIST